MTMTAAYVLIALTTVFSSIAVALAVRVMMRNRTRRRALRDASDLAAKGECMKSLRLLVKAEALWEMESLSGSPKSITRSLAELAEIVGVIDQVAQALEHHVDVFELKKTIASLRELFALRTNFRWDARSMYPETTARYSQLQEQLHDQREALRSRCRSLVPKQANSLEQRSGCWAAASVRTPSGRCR